MNIVELFTLHLAVYFVEKSSQKFIHLYRYEKCRELFSIPFYVSGKLAFRQNQTKFKRLVIVR